MVGKYVTFLRILLTHNMTLKLLWAEYLKLLCFLCDRISFFLMIASIGHQIGTYYRLLMIYYVTPTGC